MSGGDALPGVVIVAHDGREDVLALLGDLDPVVPVVVVDTGSADGTAAAIRALPPDRDLRVLELVNAGYARAANAGVRVLPPDVDVVLILNADVRLARDVPHRLAAALAADPGLGAVGPTVRYPSGAPQASARPFPPVGTAVLHALLGWWWPGNPATRAYRGRPAAIPADGAAGPVPVDWVSGCAIAVRRAAFEEIGGFDPGYRLFVEDVDLCDRLAAAGRRTALVPEVTVTHRVGGATSAHPFVARLAHARGLERFVAQRVPGALRPATRVLRPALLLWAVASATATALGRGRRSTTGEELAARTVSA